MEVFGEVSGGGGGPLGRDRTPAGPPGPPASRANELDDLPANLMGMFRAGRARGGQGEREGQRKLASPFTFPLRNAKPFTNIEG